MNNWLTPTFWTWGIIDKGIIQFPQDWCENYQYRMVKANDLYRLTPLKQKIYRQVHFKNIRKPNKNNRWPKRLP